VIAGRACRAALGLPLLLALPACGDPPHGFTTASRDSAGVHIVENRGIAALGPAPWMVDSVPLLDITGEGTGGPAPYQVTSAVRLGDGRIAVASNGGGEILVYRADGSFDRLLGRRGDGPGEFRTIFALGLLPGDSLAAWDALARRLSVFARDGSFSHAISPSEGGLLPRAMGWTDAGELVLGVPAGGTPPGSDAPVVIRDSIELRTVAHDGSATRSLGRFPGADMASIRNASGGTLVRPLPFGRQTLAAVAGGRIYVAGGDRYEIAEYGRHGVERLIRADRAPLSVHKQDIEDYRHSLIVLGGEGSVQLQRDEQRLLAGIRYPRTMPPVAELAADADGRLWVKDASRPGDAGPETWTVFSGDGPGDGNGAHCQEPARHADRTRLAAGNRHRRRPAGARPSVPATAQLSLTPPPVPPPSACGRGGAGAWPARGGRAPGRPRRR